jgi:hypothetical protein
MQNRIAFHARMFCLSISTSLNLTINKPHRNAYGLSALSYISYQQMVFSFFAILKIQAEINIWLWWIMARWQLWSSHPSLARSYDKDPVKWDATEWGHRLLSLPLLWLGTVALFYQHKLQRGKAQRVIPNSTLFQSIPYELVLWALVKSSPLYTASEGDTKSEGETDGEGDNERCSDTERERRYLPNNVSAHL